MDKQEVKLVVDEIITQERQQLWRILSQIEGELVFLEQNLNNSYGKEKLKEAFRLCKLGPIPIEFYYDRFGCKVEP